MKNGKAIARRQLTNSEKGVCHTGGSLERLFPILYVPYGNKAVK